ncbi:MAG: serine/threonine protein kinase [Planctomycetales bacterium]|nr:serine/threonine protein kinase [Planctomycetales bacterium]
MNPPSQYSPLEQHALASGLVSAERLGEVRQRLPSPYTEQQLSEALVQQGVLNEWQVDQLRQGRTKFTLGQYAILDTVARGGMGHVFKGEHQMLGRVEAIKVLPRSKTTPEAVACFQREIRAQAQLNHPNLVRVSYADCDGDTYYLVTEFVPGVDLRRLVRRGGPLPVDAAAWVVMQAAQGLEYAHRRGLVHRDVKPGNLLVTADGEVKLADLGLAWYLNGGAGARRDGRARIVGTCDYVAPEAISEPARILPVSDIYSLGCTLYYAVTGKVPYPGGNALEKMRRCLRDPPLDALSIKPDLPKKVVRVIEQLMEKDPRQRTPTAAAAMGLLEPLTGRDPRQTVAQCIEHYEQVLRQRHDKDASAEYSSSTLMSDTLPDSASAAIDFAALTAEPAPPPPAPLANRRLTLMDYAVWGVAVAALLATVGILIAGVVG